MREILLSLTLLFIAHALSTVLFCQDTASLTGTVTDVTGAVIQDAQVIVKNPTKGVHRDTHTNAAGEYLVDGLPPGSYEFLIQAAGFKVYQVNEIVLRVGQKARANVVLQIGAATEQTTVSGQQIAQVETQSSELAGTLTGHQITQLQLNGRDFTQLVALIPGVSNQGTEDQAVNFRFPFFSINGGRAEYNNWEVDGGDILDNGSNTFLNVNPSIDAIAEVRVLTSNYGAQYGRNGSATIETETKSGTNSFHGDAYEFVRNDVFNARNYFDPAFDDNGKPVGAPAYKKNDFGYTLGGPILIPGFYNSKKDRTFFFWSQEWRRERVPIDAPIFAQVPSAAERNGDFSDLCPNPLTGSYRDCPEDPATGLAFPNNQVRVAFNANFLLPLIPMPNGGVSGAETYTVLPSQSFDWREESIRIDHNVRPDLRAMFRLTHDSETLLLPQPFFGQGFPTVQAKIKVPGDSVVVRITANVSSRVLNEFVVSYTTNHFSGSNLGAWQRPPEATFGALFQNGFAGKLPGFGLGGSAAYNGGFGMDLGLAPFANSNPTYTYRDNLSKIVSGHNLQIGAYFVAAQKNEPNGAPLQGNIFFDASVQGSTHNPFADLLTGRIFNYSQTSLQIRYYNRYKILEPYFQDDWHVKPRVTLNLGLRLSLFGTYRDRSGQTYNFAPYRYNGAAAPSIDSTTGALVFPAGNSVDTITGMVKCGHALVPAGCLNGHLSNFGPRIGFAFDPTGSEKMAVRASYGIFFEHTNGNEANSESLEGSPPLVLSAQQFNIVGYEDIGKGTNPGVGPLYFPLDVTSIPSTAVWPYVQQWHADFQRQLANRAVFVLAYVGSKGTHLTLQRDLNQIHALPISSNPYKPGEPIGGTDGQHDDCRDKTTPSGVRVTGDAAIHLSVACGSDPSSLRPFVGYGGIDRLEEVASSSYHALQTSLRRDAGTLQFSVAYTYSHAIDNVSSRYDSNFVDSYNLRSNRASGAYDQRHILNVSYIYDLPSFPGQQIISRIFRSWQLSGITTFQTGTPFSVTNNAVYGDNAGVANAVGTGSYADLIGNPVSAHTKSVEGILGPLLFNSAAFVAPRGLTFGNSGRNSLRNPQRTNFDLALFKRFVVSEAKWFEFRGEAFNVFNHTQWAGINSGMACYGGPANSAGTDDCLATSNFLHPSSAHRSRILQLGLKFIF